MVGMIYGKSIRGKVIPMREVSLDLRRVVVSGKVFAVDHRELKKRNAWVVRFHMTDNTNSVTVSKFMGKPGGKTHPGGDQERDVRDGRGEAGAL